MQELKNGVIVSSFVGSNGHIGRVLVKTNLTLIISRVEDITWRISFLHITCADILLGVKYLSLSLQEASPLFFHISLFLLFLFLQST